MKIHPDTPNSSRETYSPWTLPASSKLIPGISWSLVFLNQGTPKFLMQRDERNKRYEWSKTGVSAEATGILKEERFLFRGDGKFLTASGMTSGYELHEKEAARLVCEGKQALLAVRGNLFQKFSGFLTITPFMQTRVSGQTEYASESLYALAFGAHPDDVELACGATLLKIMAEGERVAVCDLTRGEMGTLGTPETRQSEAEAATAIMGYQSRISLDLGDSKLPYTEENLTEIIKVIRHFRPVVVFANPPDERHPDHSKASKLVTDALYYAGLKQLSSTMNGAVQQPHRPRHLLYYIQFKHLEPDLIVDVTESFATSRKGVQAFGSQFYHEGSTAEPETMIKRKEFLTGLEARARYFGEQIGVIYGEGFKLPAPFGIRSFSGAFPPS